jgi:hypothetical protein
VPGLSFLSYAASDIYSMYLGEAEAAVRGAFALARQVGRREGGKEGRKEGGKEGEKGGKKWKGGRDEGMDGEVVARPQSLSARWYRLDLPLDSRLLPSLPSPRSPSQASPCLLFFDELDAIVGGSAGETRGGKGYAAEARVRPGPALIECSLSLGCASSISPQFTQ